MNYNIILRPLIGAGIGYVTNWIAIKMLFRPLKPIKIGNFTLPFTPGIIPKNKERIAESIANAIRDELLTEKDITETLLSDNIKEILKNNINQFIEIQSENSCSIEDCISSFSSEEIYNQIKTTIESKITKSIYHSVIDANLGNLIANQIELSAQEKLKGSMLGFLGGNAIVSSIYSNVSVKLNEYIVNEGENIISNMVKKELDNYTSQTVGSFIKNINYSNIDISAITLRIYEKIVLEKFSEFLNIIDISKIIKNKINSMDMLDLEKLILSIMKKELNALVNLGALIGLVLGMLNLLF